MSEVAGERWSSPFASLALRWGQQVGGGRGGAGVEEFVKDQHAIEEAKTSRQGHSFSVVLPSKTSL